MMNGFGSINLQILVGRLGDDPEIRFTPSGKKVANLSLATTHRFKVGEDWKDETTWHRIICWNADADFASKFLKKGSLAIVTGRTAKRSWEKDGQTNYITEVIADSIQAPEYRSGSIQPPPAEYDTNSGDDYDERLKKDVPF